MGSITTFLNKIITAKLGKDIRQSIHDAIKQTYDDATANGNANMEVSIARGVFDTLGSRLDTDYKYLYTLMSSMSVGGPKELFYSLSALLTTYPNGTDYTVLVFDVKHTDGAHIYIWNSSSWVDAGVYQGVEIGVEKVGLVNLDNVVDSLLTNAITGIRTKNLFNKQTAIMGKYVDWQTGEIKTPTDLSTVYYAGYYIKLTSLQSLTIKYTNQFAFYDSNKKYISGQNIATNKSYTVTPPENAAFIRITTIEAYLNKQQVEVGTTTTPFVPYLLLDTLLIPTSSIGTDKLSYVPIEGQQGKNLFDKSKVTSGYYVQNSSGNLVANSSYSVSEYIRIFPGTEYTINYFDQVAFYDINKTYISGVDGYQLESKTFITPSNAAYIVASVLNTRINTYQLEKGTSTTAYEAFKGTSIKTGFWVQNENVKDNTIGLSKLQDGPSLIKGTRSKNLFNKSKVNNGYYVSVGSGVLNANVNYSASDYIEIEPGTNYTINHYDQVAFYDDNQTFISGVDGYQLGVKTITSPSNAKYIRVSVQNIHLDTYQLEKGTVATSYAPPGYFLNETIFDNETKSAIQNAKTIGLPFKTIRSITRRLVTETGLQIKLLGDSITHGVGGTGWVQNGEQIGTTTFYTSPNSYCWGNLLRGYLGEKFSCTVKNWGTTGRTSGFILQNITNLVESEDDIIILMIGTNNRNVNNNSTKEQYRKDLISIAEYVKSLGKEIILMSANPVSIENETDPANQKSYHMEDVDSIVMSVAAHYNMEYISLYKHFMNYCELKGITIDSLLKDGIHPNDEGYLLMFNLICDALGIGRKRKDATW
ncbi:SGNH/GDSL hydrolase family protein [Niallia taxi]|uniref:SGNH/GDSL hydrolase family protein n=1 Tax=Niallia taxi TaxID=2499688 RepID=UPI0021A7332D|nr:SGNH/GDSL hydrolase family protein [Niallia taxi]MCT2342642.1 SGNH/GDSL hydrolase family protein [Niallia taxi]